MIRNYTVFSAEQQRINSSLTLANGQVVQAEIPAFVVQLVPVNHGEGGTVQLTETGDPAAASALFTKGRTIQATFVGV